MSGSKNDVSSPSFNERQLETRPRLESGSSPPSHCSTTAALSTPPLHTMVVPSERRDLLQKWRQIIHDFAFFLHLKEMRHSYLAMCTMVRTLEDHRYLDRSFLGRTMYIAISDTQIMEMIRPMKPPVTNQR